MINSLDTIELSELLASSASGDQNAFAKLYKITSPYLNALVVRVVTEPAVAQEVLQEAYIQIWQQVNRFDPARGAPMAWLTNIVRSRALDRVRHEKSQHSRVEKVSVEPMLSVIEDDSQHARFSSEFKKLAHCLQPISTEQRRSIVLAFCYGLSHSEISDKVNAPIGTVKSWVRRGLNNVRKCMKS